MTIPSWDDAPVWATVLLRHYTNEELQGKGLYAFAESYEDGSRFMRSDDIGIVCDSLNTTCWEIVEKRPKSFGGDVEELEPEVWDGEKMVGVGDRVAFKYTPDEPWKITHIGTGLVCYTNGIEEYSATHGLFKSTVVPYDGVAKVQQVIREIYGKTVEKIDIEDFLIGESVI